MSDNSITISGNEIPTVNLTEPVPLEDFLDRMRLVVQNFGTYWKLAQANKENPEAETMFPNEQTLLEWKDNFDELFEVEDLIKPQSVVYVSETLGILKDNT